jgi:hypothetical protein
MRSDLSSRAAQVVTGVVLIALGLLFLADRMMFTHAFSRYWPVLLIVWGLGHAAARRKGGGVWLIGTGVILLLHTLDIFPLNDSWPLFIVIAGLNAIWGGLVPRRRRPRLEDDHED